MNREEDAVKKIDLAIRMLDAVRNGSIKKDFAAEYQVSRMLEEFHKAKEAINKGVTPDLRGVSHTVVDQWPFDDELSVAVINASSIYLGKSKLKR